ncbi:MAG: hypothetical protein JRE64_14185 [Deltaproteobacteria bacterium]|nr:hypothetical protein [Deltaproteobacteria bacterium]
MQWIFLKKTLCHDRQRKKLINFKTNRGVIQLAKIKTEIINILLRYLSDLEKICYVDKAFVPGG